MAVDYRLAPQYTYPAALDDAIAAYEGILANGYDHNKMIIIGDSAGGNLSAALLVALRDKNLPLPKLAVLISPCTSFSSDDAVLFAQYAKNDGVDVTLSIYNDDKMSPTSISGGFLIPSTRWRKYLHRR